MPYTIQLSHGILWFRTKWSGEQTFIRLPYSCVLYRWRAVVCIFCWIYNDLSIFILFSVFLAVAVRSHVCWCWLNTLPLWRHWCGVLLCTSLVQDHSMLKKYPNFADLLHSDFRRTFVYNKNLLPPVFLCLFSVRTSILWTIKRMLAASVRHLPRLVKRVVVPHSRCVSAVKSKQYEAGMIHVVVVCWQCAHGPNERWCVFSCSIWLQAK